MVDAIKKYNKIIISVIAVLAIFAVLPFAFKKGTNSLTERQRRLMRYDQVQDGEEAIDGTDYVTFDAFFLEDLDNDGNADGLRGTEAEIGSTPELYFDLRVTGDVKLINGQISFVNSNVSIDGTLKKGSLVPNNTSVNGTAISLNELNPGFAILQSLVVKTNLTNDIKSYSGINKIILTGTVTDLNGNVITDIEKEVSYTVDWHGDSLSASISGSGKFDEPRANTNHKVVYNVTSRETEGQLFLKDANLEATISKVNGKDPVSVKLIGNSSNYVDWSYDSETRKLTAKREAVLDGTLITTQAYSYKSSLTSYNDWKIEVVYPWSEDDDKGFGSIYVKTWYTAFNNEEGNTDLTKTSNVAQTTLSANYYTRHPAYVDPIDHDITMSIGKNSSTLGKYFVEKTEATSIYNGAELEDSETDYKVSWNVYVPSVINDNNKGGNDYTIVLDDNGGEKLNNSLSIKDYVTYKTISFRGLNDVLNTTGTITMTDADTGEILHVFTSLDWNDTYTFEGDVRTIKLSVNGFQYKSISHDIYNFRYQLQFNVNIVKTIDNNAIAEGIPYADFENYGSITSRYNLQGYNGSELMTIYGRNTNYALATASYANASSQAYISLSKSQVHTTETSDLNIYISTNSIDDVSKSFKNGEYLVVVPKEILHLNIKNITSSIDDVNVIGYEVGKLADGREFIKILTENTADEEKRYTLTLETDIVPDPTKTDGTGVFELYAYNPNCHNYLNSKADIYDLNGNNDVEEKVSYNTSSLTFIAPNEIITTSMLTNYSESGSTTVAPLIAEVNPKEDDAEAKVEISLTNNSEYSAKNIRVIGKVAYDDNTYQIGGGSLGSEYDVQMTADGITYPSELEGKLTIYYSEVETPTEDLNNPANGWKLKEATDFTKVKTYMIILDDYIMAVGEGLLFSYEIEMPITTENINKVTYFTHGVYYDLVTDAGLYSSAVGGAKLGIRMSRQYDLELTDLKIASERPIAGSTYLLTDEDGNQKILSTDKNGKAVVKDLYVDKEYKLKQLSVNSPYILDDEEKTIKITNDSNDDLVNSTTGTFKTNELASDKKLVLVHENETKYTIVLTDKDYDTDLPIEKSMFKITGKGYEEGKNLRTNHRGELTLKNLYIDEVYEIEQTFVSDYLLTSKFTIRLRRDNDGNVKITYTKAPIVGKPASYTNAYLYTWNGEDRYYQSSDNSSASYFGIPLDLTGLSEKYKISGTAHFSKYSSRYSNTPKLRMWIEEGECNNSYPDYDFDYIYDNNTSSNIQNYEHAKANRINPDNSVEIIDLVGGSKYCLKVAKDWNMTLQVYIPTLSLVSGDEIEYVYASGMENINPTENLNASQTLQDSDSQDAPVLKIDVRNAKIPKYTLNITKKDAESGATLAGAQYKITGPGIPESGKYITTDENGHASIELNKSVNYTIVNGFDYRQYSSEYKIQEVLAPVGYTLDKKSVTFNATVNLENGTLTDERIQVSPNWYTYNYVTDFSTENNNALNYSAGSEKRFVEATWDNDNNTLNVVMEDYPLITITKKDAETGELLPNTLFALFEVKTANGNQVLTPATDPQGNIIGDEIIVDGKTYYAVATDENGKIVFNLGSGQYKLKEIQAADEKYEIDGSDYYFGVGETVPYQASGIAITDSFPTINGWQLQGYNASIIKATSDGGWIILGPTASDYRYIAKYDADYNLQWKIDNFAVPFYGTVYEFSYFDDPDRIEKWRSQNISYGKAIDIVELSNGDFLVDSQYYGLTTRIDKDGNILSEPSEEFFMQKVEFNKVCTYEGNTDENGWVSIYKTQHNPETDEYELRPEREWIYDSSTGTGHYGGIVYHNLDDPTDYDTYGDAQRRDDETYYCYKEYHETFYSSSSKVMLVPASDGGYFKFYENYSRSNYARFADGTDVKLDIEEIALRYNANGQIVGKYDIGELFKEAKQAYIDKYQLSNTASYGDFGNYYYHNLFTYPNGDILLISNSKDALKIRYNANEDKFDVVFFTPMGYNGNSFSTNSFDDSADYRIAVQLLDNGGFAYMPAYYTSISKNGTDAYYNTELQQLENNNSFYRDYNYGDAVIEFDGNGKISNLVMASSTYRTDRTYAEENGYEDYKHIYGYLNAKTFYRLSDGSYLFGTDPNNLYCYNINGQCNRELDLANGDTIDLNHIMSSYLLYKVNKDGYVEWIKSYQNIHPPYGNYNGVVKIVPDSSGKKLSFPVYISGQDPVIKENGSDVTIPVNYNPEQYGIFIMIEELDEVIPESPEAYTLNIENKRKEYKITSTSNVGGTIKVTKPDGNEETINNGTLETVKYGDDNVNTITITPDTGYVISSVKVNGEDASYKVNEDGSVTLDTIKDIRENKSINVTFEYGKSTVIVKHYLNGTTESVFSDEILTGTITTPYSVDPKSSELYSVATENGEIILPDNMTGTFKVEPQTVIFYYVENEVELRVNYYVDGTDTELAPTNVERKVLRSTYQTAPLEITNYELTRTIGEEEGTLTRDVTEVTYMYQEGTKSTITIRYVDKETNKDIIDPIVKTVTRHEPYTTDDPVELPAKYRYTSVSGVPSGTAEDANIEVIYYYEVIPFNISTDKKINSVLLNGEKQTITDGKNVSISPKKKDNLIVYYEIEVKNTGDIPATFKVVEGEVPGFEIYDIGEFTKVGDNYVLNVELQPGDSKTYKIGYKWNQKDYGISTNKVEITEVTGKEGYPEPDEDDNKSTATVETKIPKEVIPDTIIIPDTVDKIMTSIMIFIGSLIGIIVSLILIKKKRMNN